MSSLYRSGIGIDPGRHVLDVDVRVVPDQVPVLMKPAKFWKAVGGHEHLVQVNGRWHWAGSSIYMKTDEVMRRFKIWCDANRERGLIRVKGHPPIVKSLYKKYGAKANTLRDHLPEYSPPE